jgi:3-phosphoshikimate 1-carboxyvinyltransferase
MTNPLPITPLARPVNGMVAIPGSKSITNRALLLAALAEGPSRVTGALFSDDTRYMAAALQALGITVRADEPGEVYEVEGKGGRILAKEADLFVGNAGTAARFLTAFLTLGHGRYRLDGIPRMRQRPMGDLLDALRQLGVDVRAEHGDDCLPIIVRGHGLAGGKATLRAGLSSQFLSALLMVAPLSRDGVEIALQGELASQPYVEMTMRMMEQWGARATHEEFRRFHVPGGQRYRAQTYRVEPDASGASYFFAAAAVTGGRVRVEGIGYPGALQGDLDFVKALGQMGCLLSTCRDYTEVRGPERLRGIDVDMNAISDTVMTLAAIAPFADGPTTIRNVAHIRHKETDRLAALATELRRLGVTVEEREDGLTIHPAAALRPAVIETYDDHRMAMSFAITGLRAPGIALRDPECVNKTFPDFFERLAKLCGQI